VKALELLEILEHRLHHAEGRCGAVVAALTASAWRERLNPDALRLARRGVAAHCSDAIDQQAASVSGEWRA
jgi:hypothetical protein